MHANTDRIQSALNLSCLYYGADSKMIPLPDWCLSLLELGRRISLIEAKTARIVVALAVPTRSFASVLIATGVVIENSTKQLNSLARDQHLKYVSSLEYGTNVVYRDDRREFKGKVSNYYKRDDEQYIEIQIGVKEKKGFRLRDHAAYITVSDKEAKFRNYQNGKSIKNPGEFLTNCLGNAIARNLMSRTEFDCLIVGQLSVLHSEISETQIIFDDGQSHAIGYLQEVLRVKQFLNSDQPYRCSVIPSSYSDTYTEIGYLYPPVVIFDSAHAFMKHNHNWPSTHCVAILDRTERSFMEAVALLNQNYTNRVENKSFEFSLILPDSIEAMVFQEHC